MVQVTLDGLHAGVFRLELFNFIYLNGIYVHVRYH